MRVRVSPSFVVAVLALVLAAGGVGYAAGKITSAQIKDNTVQSRDVKNRTLTAVDLKPGGLGRSLALTSCRPSELFMFQSCIRMTPYVSTGQQSAILNCSDMGGRLPTTAELRVIASQTTLFTWADGNPSSYEFSGDWTTTAPFRPLAFDQSFNEFGPTAGSQPFHYHCLTVR